MKVKELIAKLQQQDPEAEVSTEGCDCIGDSADVITLDAFYREGIYRESYQGNTDVIITRSKE